MTIVQVLSAGLSAAQHWLQSASDLHLILFLALFISPFLILRFRRSSTPTRTPTEQRLHDLQNRPALHFSNSMMNGIWLASTHSSCFKLLKDDEQISHKVVLSSDYLPDLLPFVPTQIRQSKPFQEFFQCLTSQILSLDSAQPKHKLLHNFFLQQFSATKLHALQPIITSIAVDLFHTVASLTSEVAEFDLVNSISDRLPVLVLCEILGLPHSTASKLSIWAERIEKFFDISAVESESAAEEIVSNALQAFGEFSTFMDETIQQKKTSAVNIEDMDKSDTDLISSFITLIKANQLTVQEVKAQILFLLSAATITVSSAISSSVLALLQSPKQLKFFQNLLLDRCDPASTNSRPAAIDLAVNELLRFHPPVQSAYRSVAEESSELMLRLKAELIQESLIKLDLLSANRDPLVFDHDEECSPDQLSLTRKSANKHLSFGLGSHSCVGRTLGVMQIKLFFQQLFTQFDSIELAEPEKIQWTNDGSGIYLSLQSLKLITRKSNLLGSIDQLVAKSKSTSAK